MSPYFPYYGHLNDHNKKITFKKKKKKNALEVFLMFRCWRYFHQLEKIIQHSFKGA